MSATPSSRAILERPNLDWYRKAAKKKLKALRAQQSPATLAGMQRAIAREHGFTSWRALKDHIDEACLQKALDENDGPALAKLLRTNPGLSKSAQYTWTHPSGERRPMPAMVIAACLRKNIEMVRALIRAGVSVNQPAVYVEGRPDIMRVLLDAGMNPNALTFPENCTGLMYSAFINDIDNARLLLNHKADPRIALANCGSTALHWLNWRPDRKDAAETVRLAKLLIDAVADVNARTFSGLNGQPITDEGNLYLIEHGGATPLHWAAAHGTESLVRTLLTLGAHAAIRTVSRIVDRQSADKQKIFQPVPGFTPADLAKQKGHSQVVKLLETTPITIETGDALPIDPTPFIEAIKQNDTPLAAKLLKANPALIHANDPDGAPMLSVAVESDRHAIVKLLIERGADVNALYGNSAHTPMSWAMTVGAFKSAAVLLKAGVKPDLFCVAGLDEVDFVQACFDNDGYARPGSSKTGSTRYADGEKLSSPPVDPIELASDALYIACRNGRMNVVKFLLTQKVDLNFRAYMGGTPLHWANCNGDPAVIQMLLAAGADAASRDDVMRATPRAFGICVPASWGHITWLKRAIARDKSLVNIFDARGTPLHEAARSGAVGAIRTLLKAGADISARDADGKSPQDLARENNRADAVALLERKAKATWSVESLPPHRKSHKIAQWKPIMDAAYAGDAKKVAALLDAGTDPNVISTTPHQHRPLHRAIAFKKTAPRGPAHLDVVRILLDRGADPHQRATQTRLTALQLAAIGTPIVVPLLRKYFEPFDIWHAAVMLDANRMKALLKKDRSLATEPDANGWQPLHYCAASALFQSSAAEAKAQAAIAKALLAAGANPNATFASADKWPISVLYHACGFHDNPALTKLLMQAGATACDNESVYHASDENHQACLDIIERYTDKKQLTAECTRCLASHLHWDHIGSTKWLLDHGADPNYFYLASGQSAFHAAIVRGAADAVLKLLIDHGADPKLKTKDGKTALRLAQERGRTRVIAFLKGMSK